MSKKNITIVGGSGQMGQCLIKYFKTIKNIKVFSFNEDDWNIKKHTDYLKKSDVVIISVPIFITNDIIIKASKYINKNTVLVDITSIKTEPLECMMKYHDGPVLGLHPIFGPTIEHSKNQVIVYCDGRCHEKYDWFLKALSDMDFTLEKMTALEHDQAMDIIQGIEHFSVYCLGSYLKNKNINLNLLKKIASPVYEMELNIVGRLFAQDANLYADIIMSNKGRTDKISEFADFLYDNAKKITENDKEYFIKNFNSTSKWMGDFAKDSYKSSDEVLETLFQIKNKKT